MLVVCGLVLGASWGCNPQETVMEMESVEEGPGGHMGTLTLVGDDILVAPGQERLYVRSFGAEEWDERSGRWPAQIEDAGQSIFETIFQMSRGGSTAANRLFEAVGPELWVVGIPSTGQRPRLLRSMDVGESWDVLEFPERMREEMEDGRPGFDGGGLPTFHRVGPQLYLLGEKTVYQRLGKPGTDLGDVEWKAIDLQGVEALEEGSGDLPTAIRHYLPAQSERPYEVVSTFGRDQRIYRRDADDESFREVGRRRSMDLDLIASPDGEWLWMTDGQQVLRSGDGGEEWEAVTVARHSLAPEDYRQLQVVVDEGVDEVGYQLWVLGNAGSLWMSDNGGESWDEISARDPDGRPITGVVSDGADRLWISTGGRGVWRAGKRDWQWQEYNEGLKQAGIFDAYFSGTRTLTVGTEAGLYTHRLDAPEERWEEEDGRATTALWYDDEEGQLITGTQGGAIVVKSDEGERTSEVAAIADGQELEFLPAHMAGLEMAAETVLMLGGRAGSSERLAWSYRQGAMNSNDGGESWRRMDLGGAFAQAVQRSRVTAFFATEDQNYYAVTRARRSGEPTQVWRSGDQGQLWQVTYSVIPDEEALPLQLMERPGGSGLVMAQGSRLALSDDHGETWMNISGPWESGQILGIAEDDGDIAVVYHLGQGTALAWLDGSSDRTEVVNRYRLRWPSRQTVGHRPLDVEVEGDRVLMQDRNRLYVGGTPQQASGGPAQISVVLGLAAVIALISLAFGYLRIWERGV